jgi:hypothetical protein
MITKRNWIFLEESPCLERPAASHARTCHPKAVPPTSSPHKLCRHTDSAETFFYILSIPEGPGIAQLVY